MSDQLEHHIVIIRHIWIIQGGFVAAQFAAGLAAVNDNPTFFTAVFDLNWLEHSLAVVRPVTGKHIYM